MTSPEGGPSKEDKSQTNPDLVEVAKKVMDTVTPTSVSKGPEVLEGVATTVVGLTVAAGFAVKAAGEVVFRKGEKSKQQRKQSKDK
jgi:hypothetical protein